MPPNGLPYGPRKFTKLTKPPLAVLKLEGIITAIYIDDLIIIGETYEECLTGSIKTIKMFLPFRSLIHPDKFANTKNNLPRVHIFLSKPLCEKRRNTDQKKTPHLDTFHAVNMLLSVTDHKKGKLQKSYNSFLEKGCLKIRELATLIGTLTATFPGKKLGPQYDRGLNKCKTYALKKSIDNSECSVTLSKDALLDLKWWRYNIITPPKSLQYPPISKVIYTDASNVGWGASCEGMSTGGPWLLDEKQWHTNALELKAILLTLKYFIKEEKIHIEVFSDSATAIDNINKIGNSYSDICHPFHKADLRMGRKERHSYNCNSYNWR